MATLRRLQQLKSRVQIPFQNFRSCLASSSSLKPQKIESISAIFLRRFFLQKSDLKNPSPQKLSFISRHKKWFWWVEKNIPDVFFPIIWRQSRTASLLHWHCFTAVLTWHCSAVFCLYCLNLQAPKFGSQLAVLQNVFGTAVPCSAMFHPNV